ncbi:hypothetical protein GQX74_013855 [Glossina fuscipes]|nr:hypothetical protein GQX74_013855 [Glossina fuscipes]
MVVDVPPQKRFPEDNFAEWNNGHPLGLRTVHAYVLVFDMGNLETFRELKDISTLVRKHWRCGYVECSAQYNYKIGDVFRELMGCTSTGGVIGTEFSQSNRNKGRCTIL